MPKEREVREVLRRLAREGWESEPGRGSHVVFRRAGRMLVVPTSKRELPIGTWRNIARGGMARRERQQGMTGHIYEAVLSPAEGGGYDVRVPDLPGCFSFGDDRMSALAMAADAMRTYVASLMLHGSPLPEPTFAKVDESEEAVPVYFETDASYVVPGERMSAAEAARRLGVSAGRVTHLIASGALDGYRIGRHTYVTVTSVERRIQEGARPGRPRTKIAS